MKKAVSYCRVSTEDQVRYGVSLKNQEQKIKQYAELYDLKIIETITDAGKSAKDLNREGIQKVLAMMKRKEIDAVIVSKLDRLTRSVRDLADIIDLCNKKDISLISVNENLDTGTAAGRMIINMLATISQWERETIGERTKSALEYKKNNGFIYNYVALYGFKKNCTRLIPDSEEQEIVKAIMIMYNKSIHVSAICRELQDRGYKTRCGKIKWHDKVVRKIIDDAEVRNSINQSLSKLAA